MVWIFPYLRDTILLSKSKEVILMKYVCDLCGWEYDEAAGYPEGGIAPGTKWEDVPEDFECPLCRVGKDQFSAESVNLQKRLPFGGRFFLALHLN